MSKLAYYAVRVGREGPAIYNTWQECERQIARWPGAAHKSFKSRGKAEEWLKRQEGKRTATRKLKPTTATAPVTALTPAALGSNISQFQLPRTTHPPAQPAPPLTTAPILPIEQEVHLSAEQQRVFDLVASGKSVFFTGPAGTGKSYLLRKVMDHLQSIHRGRGALAVTASTGIASVNVDGVTLHSWSGILTGQSSAHTIARRIDVESDMESTKERWQNVKTLIIDEISMIDGALFDKLEYIARYVRKINEPFGGIQLVIAGDFAQLPPVSQKDREGVYQPTTFAFQAATWDLCMGLPILLQTVFRQRDPTFVNILNAMRIGQLTPAMRAKLRSLSRPVIYNDGVEPSELYPTRKEVQAANEARLMTLASPEHTYKASDEPGLDDAGNPVSTERAKTILNRLVVPEEITLKIGAQVMLIKNMIQGVLVNGSLGKVIGFVTSRNSGRNPVDGTIEADSHDHVWPVVRFLNGEEMVCTQQEFTSFNASGEATEARREQIPLILAWALSVHKSQGQTLDRVKVDLGRTFEKGQAYVALSRAVSMEQLQVLNFRPEKVMAHKTVIDWYKRAMES